MSIKLSPEELNDFLGKKESPKTRQKNIKFRILIVCEGAKTEVNYFEAFPVPVNSGMKVNVECEGKGMNTLSLVNEAERLDKEAKKTDKPYDFVWVVFDCDSFTANFDNAIKRAKSLGYGVAWSNEAFELWYLLHFENRTNPMSRADYQKRLTDHISKKVKGYKYKKNDPKSFSIMTTHGSEDDAIKFAERTIKAFGDRTDFVNCNPGTTVHLLVKCLRGDNDEFNDKVKAKIKTIVAKTKK